MGVDYIRGLTPDQEHVQSETRRACALEHERACEECEMRCYWGENQECEVVERLIAALQSLADQFPTASIGQRALAAIREARGE